MLLSMTGYGKAEKIINNRKIHIEIKALNSKNIDIVIHISSYFFSKELEIRSVLTQELVRGKIDFNLWMEELGCTQNTTINKDVIASYVEQIKAISKEMHLDEPQDWWQILGQLPAITQPVENQELTDEEWKPILEAIHEAIHHLKDFRKQEGQAVRAKFDEKLQNIGQYLQEINVYENMRIEKIRSSIEEGLQKLRNIEVDKNRLEQEMIYYIEKLDINEEKQRLGNHLKYFAETMDKESNQGKKLGFIAQEMGREINTLGSKSNQADMQNLVVKMKDELEQIKEQVLNVL